MTLLARGRAGAVQPQYFSVAEAEMLTGLSRWTWRSWAYSGRVASIKLGKRLVIPVAEIERVIAEGTRPRVESPKLARPR
jgi:hypothetical protein